MIDDLLAHVIAAPDDRDAFLVLGDAMQAAGDPRGELVIAQTLGGAPARERELIAQHRTAWLGDLATVPAGDVELEWHRGFVRAVRLGRSRSSVTASDFELDDLVARLATLPATELVRVVTLESGSAHQVEWNHAVDALAEHGVPPNVAQLALLAGERGFHGRENLRRAVARIEWLHELVIAGESIWLDVIDLPELIGLTLWPAGLSRDLAHAVFHADWAFLDRLELGIGVPGERGCSVTPGTMRDAIHALRAPRLRHLGLRSCGFTDELAAIVAQAPIAEQLESLDLSDGTLSDSGAAELRHLAHLRELHLSHAFVSPSVRDELSRLGPRVIMDDPQSPDDDFRRPRRLE